MTPDLSYDKEGQRKRRAKTINGTEKRNEKKKGRACFCYDHRIPLVILVCSLRIKLVSSSICLKKSRKIAVFVAAEVITDPPVVNCKLDLSAREE